MNNRDYRHMTPPPPPPTPPQCNFSSFYTKKIYIYYILFSFQKTRGYQADIYLHHPMPHLLKNYLIKKIYRILG